MSIFNQTAPLSYFIRSFIEAKEPQAALLVPVAGVGTAAELQLALDAMPDFIENGSADEVNGRDCTKHPIGYLPMRHSDADLPVYLYQVEDHTEPGTMRSVIVIINEKARAGADALPAPEGFENKPFDEIFADLPARAKSFFENIASFECNLTTAEALRAEPRFAEMLGWLRCGYSHTVEVNRCGGTTIYY